MEAVLTGCLENNLRHFTYRNAIFMCERLCAEFPSEVNLQLIANCYLQNYQACCATLLSFCLNPLLLQLMDLLNEAEAVLCPPNKPGLEVPNGAAAGHYLLRLIYQYTDRRRNAIRRFKKALLIDPLMWAAYEELFALGAMEEAAVVFGEPAATCVQKQYTYQGSVAQKLHTSNEDHHLSSARSLISAEDVSLKQLKQLQGSSSKDMLANCQGASGRIASQSTNGGSTHLSLSVIHLPQQQHRKPHG